MIGIYKIESPSGRVYVGQSWDIKRRLGEHKRTMSYKHRKLNSSFVKHGVDSHSFSIIHLLPNDVSQDVINNYEVLYMDLFSSCGVDLLNIKGGGNGYGKHSEETKKIIREKRSKQITTEETRKKISHHFKTIKRTREWIDKVAAKSIGRVASYETRKKQMKPIVQIGLDGVLIKEWDCSRVAAKELGTSESNICNCLTGRSKSACGHKWVYA